MRPPVEPGNGSDMSGKIWFITAASRGAGRALTEAALARGDKVAACASKGSAFAGLSEIYEPDLLPIDLDVRSEGDVREAMRVAVDAFGRLDVVVCCAAYAVLGSIAGAERAQFDTNVFGTLWVVRAALPYLRRQGSGHVLFVSGLPGGVADRGLGLHHAARAAVEALGETLAAEAAACGIKVTLIEADDDEAGRLRNWTGTAAGPLRHGSSATAAAMILRVVDTPSPPLRLPRGAIAPATQLETFAANCWDICP